jgi:uncharacterized membrane protein
MKKISYREAPVPGDLLAATLIAILTLIFSFLPESFLPLRLPLGLITVLFLPGYVLIAALFPRKDDLDVIERVALSFGISIAVVPLIGLGLNYAPWGIRPVPVAISIVLFIIIIAVAAHLRRSKVAQEDLFTIDFREEFRTLRDGLLAKPATRIDHALTLILVLTILLSFCALIYLMVIPKPGEKFTGFYILGPSGKAYDYPTSVVSDQNSTIIIGVFNHEYSFVNYSIRINIQNSTLLAKNMSLGHNQTWEQSVSYILRKPGKSQKLEFLLYKDDNFTSPYRDLHLWVNVSGNNSSDNTKR